jgi:PAS domain S-box-containing protein
VNEHRLGATVDPWGTTPVAADVRDAVLDPKRLEALRRIGLLDTATEEAFDRITRLATRILGVPTSLVSLVGQRGQFFKSQVGLREPWASLRATPLSHSICQHVVASGDPLVVRDARVHPHLRTNLALKDLGVVAYAGVPLRAPTGEVLGTVCAIDDRPRDWTDDDVDLLSELAALAMAEIDRRAIAAQLEERAEMLDLSSDAIFVLDFEGVIHFWNTGATALLGYTREEAVGRNSQDLLIPSYPRPFEELRAELRRTGRWSGEATYHHRDEHVIDVALRWAMRTAQRGLTEAVLVSATDISERRRLERMKDEFVSVVSHELRTPLTAIRGALGLLAGGAVGLLPAEARPMVEIANANVERLGRLVNDVLDLQRWDAGEVSLVASDVDLGELVDRVLSAMRPMADSLGVHLTVERGSATVRADADRMEQLVMNLVGNAIKFSPRGGRVRLATSGSQRQLRPGEERRGGGAVARLSVRDEGRGIAADQLERIFGRFVQVDASDTRHGRGTGLGLSICRAIVQQHGGRIWAESVPGEGATFIVALPRHGARRS